MTRGRALVLILVLFLVTVLVGSVVAVVTMLRGGGGSVEDGSTLVLRPGGSIPEQPVPDDGLSALTGGSPTSMLEFDSALKKAAVDDRVARVLVEPGTLGVGYARVFELRDALRRFSTDSGKPVTCWLQSATNKEYLLATGCDSIYMAPSGLILVNGLHFGVTFYKGTLDKLGIKADFARAGKYKSAVEPMTSEQMSPAFRSMLESMADSLYGELVAAVAEGRHMDEATVRGLIDDPPLTAGAGVRAGLLDGLLYRDQVLAMLQGDDVDPIPATAPRLGHLLTDDKLANELGDDDSAPQTVGIPAPAAPEPEADEAPTEERDSRPGFEDPDPDLLTLGDYAHVRPSSLGLGKGEKIAVIYCEGQIMSGESSPASGMSGAKMGSDTITEALRTARKDDSIKAVVLRVNSPGGSGLASDIMWREVILTRKVKPVVVSMSDYAASGGYYISMGADAIVAQPSTLTGSIGVFGGKYNLGGLYEKLGMRTDDVQRGAMADLFASDRGLGEQGHHKFSEFIDEFYETFITKAGAGRHMSPLAIHERAQGRVWTGAQAKEQGLVDELGNFRTALKIAAEKAGLTEDPKLVLLPHQRSTLERLLRRRGAGAGIQALLSRTSLLDVRPLSGPGPNPTEALRHLLDVAPLVSSGQAVMMTPYALDLQ